jgi:AcrR family transcriptional regulator
VPDATATPPGHTADSPSGNGSGRTRDPDTREKVLQGTYDSIARVGIAKTTMDDAARAAGVSRATVYRLFPGGRDELLRETVGWEMTRFFLHLGEELGSAHDFAAFLERALPFARDELLRHAVLQKVLETEPDRLMPLITVEQHRVIEYIADYFLPLLVRDQERGLVRSGVDLPRAAEYVARMALSLISSPGRHDLDDPAEVRRLVRGELLGGLLA